MEKREKFGSRLGFILVSAGCAIGLGNVWKFPYICGQYGGAAFILIYLLFLLILGFPILMSEFAIGRGSGKSIAKAFDELEQKGTKWHTVKWAGMAGNYLLMMFYSMVCGWMLYYMFKYAIGDLSGIEGVEISGVFDSMLASPKTMIIWTVVSVVLAFAVCALGMKNGVEKVTKVMMLVLIGLMLVLAAHSLVLKGAMEGVKFYLIPDFSSISKYGLGEVVFAAMSHAFFTLSIGMGSMEIFGSYLHKDHTLASEAKNIVLVDTFVALMAGFIIIPACFAYGVQPDAGPSLLFITLPNVFNNMVAGRIWGTLFFLFMSFASLSTVIAVYENILSFYMDGLGWKRGKAIKLNLVLIISLSLPAVLGYNLWNHIAPLGAGTTIMDLEDFLVSYNILPLGSLVFVLFCTHKNGWTWEKFRNEVNTGSGMKLSNVWKFYMAYILPLIIVVIYLKGYYDTFHNSKNAWYVGDAMFYGWMAFAIIMLVLVAWVVSRKAGASTENEGEFEATA